MEVKPAVVMTHDHLEEIVSKVAQEAARSAVAELKSELQTDPVDRLADELRHYIINDEAITNPAERWANGHHIRRIELMRGGKPKSVSWFHKFKIASGLLDCPSRPSTQHGRLREWTFRDIRLAWEVYHAHRQTGLCRR